MGKWKRKDREKGIKEEEGEGKNEGMAKEKNYGKSRV